MLVLPQRAQIKSIKQMKFLSRQTQFKIDGNL